MQSLKRFVVLSSALWALASAAPTESTPKNIGDTPAKGEFSSTAAPSSALPFAVGVYSQAAGLAQQTYCPSQAGLVVGDSTLLFTVGDGDKLQRVNIYESRSLGLVVAYEGTNISSVRSILYDVDFPLVPGDSTLGLPFGSLVDQGFQAAFLKTWPVVKAQVATLRQSHGNGRLAVVGHSLGASQASLAALALQKEFGSVDKVVTFGLPRTGNLIYANHIDKIFSPSNFSYVVNGRDFVPHVPPRIIGYQHPSGQVWINPANSTDWLYYPGQENVKGADSVLNVQFSFDDHQGHYFHTQIGATQGHCPATVGQD
ncbi:unnamed protein product [Parajaminaea phylloscopi]